MAKLTQNTLTETRVSSTLFPVQNFTCPVTGIYFPVSTKRKRKKYFPSLCCWHNIFVQSLIVLIHIQIVPFRSVFDNQ